MTSENSVKRPTSENVLKKPTSSKNTVTTFMTSEKPVKKRLKISHFGHVELSPLETAFNWMICIPLKMLPFYVAYKLSAKLKDEFIEEGQLTPSWFGHKDSTDYEWSLWSQYYMYFIFMNTLNSVMVFLTKRLCPRYQQEIMIITAFALHSVVLSLSGMLVILCQVLSFYVVAHFLRNKKYFWMWAIFMTACINSNNVKQFVIHNIPLGEKYFDMVELSFMMCTLRLISFGCYLIEHNEEVLSFTECLNFTLYVPLFSGGPIITYDIFRRDIQDGGGQAINFREIIKDIVSCVLYSVALEVFINYVHVTALGQNDWMLNQMSTLNVVSMCWIHLHIFNIKYYIFYRFSGIFAKLDGITPPGSPKCIASLYTFVDMWRYFDKGLHRLLQQCIYFPLGGSQSGLSKQFLASFLCFTFVGFWHSGDKKYMIWALTNWLGIIIESILVQLLRTETFITFKYNIGDAMYRRLCAACGSISIFGLIYTNMVFLIGYDGATILLTRVFTTWYSSIVILIITYFTNQCIIDVN